VSDNEMRVRGFRMSDAQYEAIAALAARNGRTIAEEVRVGMDAWLSISGNIKVSDERRTVAPHVNARKGKRINTRGRGRDHEQA